MVTRKYVKDYSLDDTIDSHGRLRSKAIYIGGDYVFRNPDAASGRRKRTILVCNLVGWLFFVGALLPRSLASRTMYCVLPFVASSLPLVYESTAVIVLLTANAPLRRDQADKLSDRLPLSALSALILTGTALAGFCASAVRTPDALGRGDAIFAVFCALLVAASAAVWRTARHFRTKKADPS